MTRAEAISIMSVIVYMLEPQYDTDRIEDAVEMAIKALEQKSCGDAISRDKAIVQLSHLLSDWDDDWNVGIRKCIETVKSMKSIISQPKTGYWIEHFDESGKWYECNQCHTDWGGSVNYCPNCGAKM